MRLASLLPAAAYSRFKGSELQTRLATQFANLASVNSAYDVVVVGGGIVGCATARELSIRYPKLKLALLEKEARLAQHQSGHNSGVIHAGIYYAPGSLRAKLCVEGHALTYKYCDEKNIPYKKCGKLIVAVEEKEIPTLENLYNRGVLNGVKDLKLLNADEIQSYEPNCRGLKAIWSPHTGIVDWAQVNQSYGDDFVKNGGTIFFNFQVENIEFEEDDDTIKIISKEPKREVRTKFVVTAAGLHSDRMAKITGCNPNPRIVPFRGEYLVLKPEKSDLVKRNIYPVPDPRFPFLGVHFTPRMDGSVWLGPNAVLAFKREGYKFSDFSIKDTFDALSFKGLRKLIWKYLVPGIDEMYRSFNMAKQVKLLQRFVPSLTINDVQRGPSGVRAQAIDEDGKLVEDFVFDSGEGKLERFVMHIRNAPSPAATSSLAIAKEVVNHIEQKFVIK
ncbi:l-2-hydroxyglutarate dehydrogenase-like protein [Dinothrombium tinctorium]|uniref:L-2-hydroxyglutarate dehydrogenase, mitochondrial n=1 Tax=Dinothrombium tinctorium TaxID=1965070 RepID=A0A3S3PL49_9ACAR|nr:l-2-hydroxyglutarate dehydrogenase-like protein [Dinothrombium tinctorium]